MDEVTITYDENSFTTMEFVRLGLGGKQRYYPLEQLTITFKESGTYQIQTELVFEPPLYNKKVLHHTYNTNNCILSKIKSGISLSTSEKEDLAYLPDTYLICYLNGFEEALEQMELARSLVKENFKEVG